MSEKRRKKLDNRKSQNFRVSRKIAAILQAQQRVQKIRNNPYESLEDEQEDKHIMESLINRYYKEKFTDFIPPDPLEWIQVYANILLYKYKSMDLVELVIRFHIPPMKKAPINKLLKNMRKDQNRPLY